MGQYLDGFVSLGIVQMVSGGSRGSPFLHVHLGICFSLCWGLSKTHLGVFSVVVRGEEGWVRGGLDCFGGSLYF